MDFKELLQRYAALKRNFTRVDLHERNFSGVDLQGIQVGRLT